MSNLIVKSIIEKQLSELSQTANKKALIDYLKTIVFKKKYFEYIKDDYLAFLLKFGNLNPFQEKELVKILENRDQTFDRRYWIRCIQKNDAEQVAKQLGFN